jgi:hypothetical protein
MTAISASNRDLLTAAITQFDAVVCAAPASSARTPTPALTTTRTASGVLVGELVTHGWDLAVAIGRPDLLDHALGAAAALLVSARTPEHPRDGLPFGPSSLSPPTHRPTTGSPDGWAETRHGS